MGTALETQVDEGYAGRLLAISGLLPFNGVCGYACHIPTEGIQFNADMC
jgi:hypothetical protein